VGFRPQTSETVPDVETISGWQRSLGGEDRIMIEVGCHPKLAEQILLFCQGSQFRGIGMIVGMCPVMVHEEETAKLTVK
jgi:hypothetical protein